MTVDQAGRAARRPGDRPRAVVAMSGGVDSSVTAAMLAEAGHEVVGITLQLHPAGAARARGRACCAGQDVYDARRVAARLGIAHYVLDYEERFRRDVLRDFADSYATGETPVPCARCNQRVKFRDLLATARGLGADWLATGHYVRRVEGAAGPELHAGRDAGRDQSYFLFATTRAQLERLRFPLGGLAKEEVRERARDLGLAVAAKPDSQDLCFVPDGRYADVVRRLRPDADAPGEIVHVDGRVLGRHRGIAGFTVGQRRGIGVAGPGPLYVVRVEPARRRVVVGPRGALGTGRFAAREVNRLDAGGGGEEEVTVRVRSSHRGAPARVRPAGAGRVEVDLAAPEAAVAPGQAAVFYRGTRLLGGGWIERPEAARG